MLREILNTVKDIFRIEDIDMEKFLKRAFVLFCSNVYKLCKSYFSIYIFVGVLYLFSRNDIPPLFLKELFNEINFWHIVNNLFFIYALGLLIIELYDCTKTPREVKTNN